MSELEISKRKIEVTCDNSGCEEKVDIKQPHPHLEFVYRTFHFCSEKCAEEYVES